MAFLATLTAALKAIPRIVDLIESIDGRIGKFQDSKDDRKLSEFKAELDKQTRRLQRAKTEDEVRDVIRSLNPTK